jgi:hypothetical protein
LIRLPGESRLNNAWRQQRELQDAGLTELFSRSPPSIATIKEVSSSVRFF